ncbi:MAG: GFA family protein [Deltaproteobacteria bacterium]|nr:GFA family protein [Deltaproteobacteria bacterium]
MIRAACHCTAVRFEIAEQPEWVLDCNCTICRRYGALWTYFEGADQAKLLATPSRDATEAYVWGDRILEFRRCRTCGCVYHMQTADAQQVIFGLNARLIPTLDPARVRIVQMNNSHSGYFWTRSDGPPRASHHPHMPMPGPLDWR